MNFRLFFLTLFGVTASLLAQNEQSDKLPPLPSGPLLKRAPDFSTWTVISQERGSSDRNAELGGDNDSSGKDTPAISKAFKQVRVTKDLPLICEQILDTDGQKIEIWHSASLQIRVTGNADPKIYPNHGLGDIFTTNFAASDFSGLEWISPETYAGLEKVLGKDCIVFKGKVNGLRVDERREYDVQKARAALDRLSQGTSAEAAEDTRDVDVPAIAYIDLETRLPVFVQFGKEARIYQYGVPTTKLSLPSNVLTARNHYLKGIQNLSKKAARP